jgi:hypothetical protein
MIDAKEIMLRLSQNNMALEYAAFNYDGMKLEDLKPGIIESTGVSDSCLIEVRENKKMLDVLYKEITKK